MRHPRCKSCQCVMRSAAARKDPVPIFWYDATSEDEELVQVCARRARGGLGGGRG
jgi:hypothetical protein